MTPTAAFRRLLAAGFRLPYGVEPATALEAWCESLATAASADLERGVTRLVQTEASREWPLISAVWAAMRSATAGDIASGPACLTCHGTTWVEALPYRANGGHVYEGMRRCPDCVPPKPNTNHLQGVQSPLSASDYLAWRQAREPEVVAPASPGEFLRAIQVMRQRIRRAGPKVVPSAAAPRAPGEEW